MLPGEVCPAIDLGVLFSGFVDEAQQGLGEAGVGLPQEISRFPLRSRSSSIIAFSIDASLRVIV